MKLINSKADLILQAPGLEGIYKQIEICGRTCYKSEDKITEDSAKGFVERMIKSNHTAMLEHGAVYLKFEMNYEDIDRCDKYYHTEPYSRCHDNHKFYYITTNLRVLAENNWMDDLKYLCEPTEYHEKRYTMKFITDRGVSHELVRHRVFSFAQESTRYCNYNKDKFGGEITYIIPSWFEHRETFSETSLPNYVVLGAKLDSEKNHYNYQEMIVLQALARCEANYMCLLNCELTPQQARQVLPNALKTEICMTGFESDWKHFFDLRYYGKTGKPHPDMQELAGKALEEFRKADLLEKVTNTSN